MPFLEKLQSFYLSTHRIYAKQMTDDVLQIFGNLIHKMPNLQRLTLLSALLNSEQTEKLINSVLTAPAIQSEIRYIRLSETLDMSSDAACEALLDLINAPPKLKLFCMWDQSEEEGSRQVSILQENGKLTCTNTETGEVIISKDETQRKWSVII